MNTFGTWFPGRTAGSGSAGWSRPPRRSMVSWPAATATQDLDDLGRGSHRCSRTDLDGGNSAGWQVVHCASAGRDLRRLVLPSITPAHRRRAGFKLQSRTRTTSASLADRVNAYAAPPCRQLPRRTATMSAAPMTSDAATASRTHHEHRVHEQHQMWVGSSFPLTMAWPTGSYVQVPHHNEHHRRRRPATPPSSSAAPAASENLSRRTATTPGTSTLGRTRLAPPSPAAPRRCCRPAASKRPSSSRTGTPARCRSPRRSRR